MSQAIEPFGKALLTTEDLDPVYVALWGAQLPKAQLARLLVAYWCFYHLGAAAWLSEQEQFWAACDVAARNVVPSPLGGRWPRGAERRHFRGASCVYSIKVLAGGDPQGMVAKLATAGSLANITGILKDWPLFGPWIAYKIADMLERCWGVKVDCPSDVCLLYKEPRAALHLLAPDTPERELKRLLGRFRGYKAPPVYDRACGFQEVETILCKWKSSVNGHYWVGKDIHEIRAGLKGWGVTAKALCAALPPNVKPAGILF